MLPVDHRTQPLDLALALAQPWKLSFMMFRISDVPQLY
jgi:hypothetical protein